MFDVVIDAGHLPPSESDGYPAGGEKLVVKLSQTEIIAQLAHSVAEELVDLQT